MSSDPSPQDPEPHFIRLILIAAMAGGYHISNVIDIMDPLSLQLFLQLYISGYRTHGIEMIHSDLILLQPFSAVNTDITISDIRLMTGKESPPIVRPAPSQRIVDPDPQRGNLRLCELSQFFQTVSGYLSGIIDAVPGKSRPGQNLTLLFLVQMRSGNRDGICLHSVIS